MKIAGYKTQLKTLLFDSIINSSVKKAMGAMLSQELVLNEKQTTKTINKVRNVMP